MVFKVMSNFDNFTEIEPELKKYNFMFLAGSLYISDIKSSNSKRTLTKLKKIFADAYIVEINENNLRLESPRVIDWVRNQLVAADEVRFEKENQDKLHNIMKILDAVEDELFNKREE